MALYSGPTEYIPSNCDTTGKKILKKILGGNGSIAGRRAVARTALGMPQPLTLLLVSLIAGCQSDIGERLQSGQVLAWSGLQGRWAGPVVPSDGACGPTTHGLMSVGEKSFGFDPFQGTTVIDGKVGQDRKLHGELIREGADHQQLSISFDGVATSADAIKGTLKSGRCQWEVTLRRG